MKARTTPTALRHCKKRRTAEIDGLFEAEFRAAHAQRERMGPWEYLVALKKLQSKINGAKRARGLAVAPC